MILYTKGTFKASNLSHYKNLQKTNVLKLKLLKLDVLIQLIEPLTPPKKQIQKYFVYSLQTEHKRMGVLFFVFTSLEMTLKHYQCIITYFFIELNNVEK